MMMASRRCVAHCTRSCSVPYRELQPKRPPPGADTIEQLHSTRPFIPIDLVQNTAEYLGRIAGLMSVL
jgi:hypothetical protein